MRKTMVDVIIGMQWGDEGKGKIVDVFTGNYDVIARFQGGPNAGHTLIFEGMKHVLHTIPSGIFHADKINLIGNGVIIDPRILVEEFRKLDPHGIDYRKNLYISRRAHLILPTHRLMDACLEFHKGDQKIGSTLKGIGPAYTDKTGRNGLRVGDIEREDFLTRYTVLKEMHLHWMSGMGYDIRSKTIEGLTLEEYEKEWLTAIREVGQLQLVDGELFINQLIDSGKRVLAEGAQGAMLDVDFGSYPFVTSSNTITAGVCSGLGVPPHKIGKVYGVFKAYCTRVGSGPFPTELFDETGEELRVKGHEFGSTTGRPRRCGWLDLPALRYAAMINGVTHLIMTKADVMNHFDTISYAQAYQHKEAEAHYYGFFCDEGKTEPLYKKTAGWNTDIGELRKGDPIPDNLHRYVRIIEKETGIPVSHISTGPDRSQIIGVDLKQ